MRRLGNFQTNMCYHLISRVAHRAFYLIKDVPLAAAGLIASEGATHAPQRTYCLTAKGRRALA